MPFLCCVYTLFYSLIIIIILLYFHLFFLIVVHSLNYVQLCDQPHGLQHAKHPGPLQSPGVCSTHVHWVHDAVQLSHPLLPPSPPALNLSQHQGCFQWVSSSHQVAKVWSFSISPSNEYSGLISFRMDWLDLLAVQGTLKSLLQYHTTVQKDQFFSAQHFIFWNGHPLFQSETRAQGLRGSSA